MYFKLRASSNVLKFREIHIFLLALLMFVPCSLRALLVCCRIPQFLSDRAREASPVCDPNEEVRQPDKKGFNLINTMS